jgi:hypothetical protein
MPTVFAAVFDMGQSPLAAGPSCTRRLYYDDFWNHIVTDTDVISLEWPLGTKVQSYPPTGNGTTNQFTRGGVDTGANYTQVNDIPLLEGGAATYVQSATAGHIDQYVHANLITPTDAVYHIQAVAFLYDDTTPQRLLIGADEFSVQAQESLGVARYSLAHKIYANATPLDGTSFNALQFGVKKQTAGGSTLFSGQEFLEVLTGPAAIIEEDLDPAEFAVTAAFDTVGGNPYEDSDLVLTAGPLGFRLGNQGVEINVPTPWQIERIDIGSRDEQTS